MVDESSDELLVLMVKGALREKRTIRFTEIMDEFGNREILYPFKPAAEYIKTEDREIIDKQHPEIREISEMALFQLGIIGERELSNKRAVDDLLATLYR